MRWVRATCLASLVCLWATPAFATPETDKAKEELKAGYALAQAGNCAEAITHLKESLRLDPRAITLINLADCEEKVGKLGEAMVHWGDARTRARTEGKAPIEQEATSRATALEAKVPKLTVALAKTAPAGTTVERDGVILGAPSLNVPMPVDPGPHVIIVKATGRPDATYNTTILEGEKKTIDVDAAAATDPVAPAGPKKEEEKKGGGMSPLVPIGFGLAIAGIATFAVGGIIALGKGSDAERDCPKGACQNAQQVDAAKEGQTWQTIATIGIIAGGVGAGVGVIGLVIGGGKKGADPKEPKVEVSLGPANLVLRGRF